MMSRTATGAVICGAEGWIYTLSSFLFFWRRETGRVAFFFFAGVCLREPTGYSYPQVESLFGYSMV